nr:uncharacterized protein LOC112210997 [Halyomorpha halys]
MLPPQEWGRPLLVQPAALILEYWPVFTAEVYYRVVESPILTWGKRNIAKNLAPPVPHHHLTLPRQSHDKKDQLLLSSVKKRVKESIPNQWHIHSLSSQHVPPTHNSSRQLTIIIHDTPTAVSVITISDSEDEAPSKSSQHCTPFSSQPVHQANMTSVKQHNGFVSCYTVADSDNEEQNAPSSKMHH